MPRASHPAVTSHARRGGDGSRTLTRDHTVDISRPPIGEPTHHVEPHVAGMTHTSRVGGVRSRVRPCRTCRAERRRPTHLLEYPHWASPCAPEVASANPEYRRRARHRSGAQASFRWMAACIDWRSGFGQSSFHHIPRVPQHPPPLTPGHDRCFPGQGRSPTRYPTCGPFSGDPPPNPPCPLSEQRALQ